MKRISSMNRVGLSLATLALSLALTTQSSKATPYASGVTNSAGTISFVLNESGGSVTVTYEDASTNANYNGSSTGTNLAAGKYTFALGAHTSYNIAVYKIGTGSPTQISADSSTNVIFNSPRGITVDNNPKDRYFGMVYMANGQIGGAGTTNKQKGIYIYNADISDAFNIGTNARAKVFTGGNGNDPYRIRFGSDDKLYIADDDGTRGTVWAFDRDALIGTNVLANFGDYPTTSTNHGRVGSQPCTTGSLATSNLVLYTTDQSYGPPFNSILQYNIGAGPIPATNLPTVLGNISLPGFGVVQGAQVTDLFQGPDGKFYGCCRRLNFSNPGVSVYDSTGTNLLWDSISIVGGSINAGPDLLADLQSISVSPDNKYMAVNYTDSHISVLKLTNGVPDASTIFTIQNLPNVGNGRGLAWDAADNLYAISSGQGLLRIFSLGGTTRAITGNDSTGTNGTFQLITPNTLVSVVATTQYASQGRPTPIPGVFTITRTDASNDYSAPMTINFTLTGTATNGTYTVSPSGIAPTNVVNTIVIAAGQTSTNITITPVNDGSSRPTNTVVLTLSSGGTYSSAPPVKDTVFIENTGPQLVFISSTIASSMYKRLTNDFGSFVVTRYGDTTVASYTVSTFTYGGTAVSNVAYLPAVSLTFDPGIVNITNGVFPLIDTTNFVGNKTVIVNLASGAGYVGATNVSTLTIIDSAIANPNAPVVYYNSLTDPNDITNWGVTIANNNMNTNAPDYTVDFGYDLSPSGPNYSTYGAIPYPPSGATNVLRVSVNKNSAQGSGASSGVNLVLTNQLFTGDYVVRFYLNIVQGGNASFTTEGPLFGINTTGKGTNWWSGSALQVGSPTAFNMDGVWYWLSADGGASAGDFIEYTGLGGTNNNTGSTTLSSKTRTSFTGNYKSPSPYSSGANGLLGNGSAANALGLGAGYTNAWADVEIKNVKNVVTLNINKTTVFTYANTTVWTNGYIMLGYDDPFASVGASDGAAYFSDLKVVAVAPPVITQQPTNFIAAVGATAAYSVAATFDPSAINTNGQWLFNGSAITGATNKTYSFTVTAASFGTYAWQVNDGNYTVTSSNATLRPPAFTIVTNPLASIVVAAGVATNIASAANSFSGATNYQWQLSSTNLPAPGGTNRIYNFTAGLATYGTYRVIINDNWNFATSSVAVVTPPVPSVLVPPSGRAAVVGSSPSLTVTPSTFSGVTNYQWLLASVPVSAAVGGTGRTLTLTNIALSAFGSYTVRVNDGFTSVTSSPAALVTVAVSPSIASPSIVSGGFKLSFNTEVGPGYVTELKTNLLQASWIILQTNNGTGGTVNVTNNNSSATGFYRIRLQ